MNAEEIDQDARDIVRKAGSLLTISNSNPDYLVKYLMSKCRILVDHDPISREFVQAAAELGKVAREKWTEKKAVVVALKDCAPPFREPRPRPATR